MKTPMQELRERLLIDRDNFPEMYYHINSIIEDIDSEFLEKEKNAFINFYIENVKEGTQKDNGEEFTKEDEVLFLKHGESRFNETFKND